MFQSDFLTGGQTEIFFVRCFRTEIVLLDVQIAAKRNFSGTGRGVFRIVFRIHPFDPIFGVIGNSQFQRANNGHAPLCPFVQIGSQTEFQKRVVNG